MKRVLIKIDPKDATITYEVEGIAGSSCTELSSALTAGQQVQDEGVTCEYHLPDVVPVSIDDVTE